MAKDQLAQEQPSKSHRTPLNQQGREPAPSIQPSPRLKNPMLNQRLRKPTASSRPSQPSQINQILLQLIQKRPLLLIFSLCTAMLLIAVLAVIGITHPGDPDQAQYPSMTAATPATTTTQTTAATAANSESSPAHTTTRTPVATPFAVNDQPLGVYIGMYITVGASSAIGAWFLLNRLIYGGRRRQQRKFGKRLKPIPTTVLSRNKEPQYRTLPKKRF